MNYILITGASSGIGRDLARLLNSKGDFVILCGRNIKALNESQNALEQPKNSLIAPFDITKSDQIHELSLFLSQAGVASLHCLINNAGIYLPSSFKKISEEQLKLTLDTNFIGPFLLTQALLPFLERSKAASIINISSSLGNRPVANSSVYSASKAAITNLTKTLALELAPQIRVVSISPGIIDTPIHDFHKKGLASTSDLEAIHKLQPMGCIGATEDVCSLVEYLMSAKAQWITGADFVVDGGISL